MPVQVRVATERPYDIHVGRGVLGAVPAAVAGFERTAVLSDTNVAPRYAARVGADERDLLSVDPGEGSKSFAVLERVLDFLVARGFDRDSCLVALGGGVIGDLGGLAAALYQRGIAVVQCPTSLLAQVDASVGGKTAVNLRAGKNLAGTFHQPCAVFADTDTLATLSPEEYRSGLGEVVKTALIAGETAFALLEAEAAALTRRDVDVLTRVVELCVRTKADVVARDERESGERKLLNLGHTFAHGIEHAAGYGTLPHGTAVAVGLSLAVRASSELGRLEDAGLPERLDRLLAALELPCDLDALRASSQCRLAPEELLVGMRHDKKGAAGAPRLVLPRAVGSIEHDVLVESAFLDDLLARS